MVGFHHVFAFFLSHLSHHPGLCGLSEFKGLPPPLENGINSCLVWYQFCWCLICTCVSLLSFLLILYFRLSWRTVSNGSAPLFPFLTSDWNNGTSIPSKQVTVVCYVNFFPWNHANVCFLLCYFFLHSSKKGVQYVFYVYVFDLNLFFFLIAQRLVFRLSEDLMYFIDVSTLTWNFLIKFKYN